MEPLLQHRRRACGAWLLWLLSLSYVCNSAAATIPAGSFSASQRSLLVQATLYCNITSPCKACLPKHLDSEACRPTQHAEHLTCDNQEATEHEVTVIVHRRSAPTTFPLHISRSCQAPKAEPSNTPPAVTVHFPIHNAPTSSSTNSSHSSTDSMQGGALETSTFVPSRRRSYRLGSLNLLYFELAMLVVLSGALPVVFIRKRRRL